VLLVAAAPVWAAKSRVDITCTAEGRVVIVHYKVNPTVEEPNLVRGFGLDITVDNGAKIIDVCDYPVYPGNYEKKYWVYPGSIVISDGQVTDSNTPVASASDPGALPGPPDSNGMTIEMGSLYYPTGDGSVNAPDLSGTLLKFTVDKDQYCVTITENAVRGGVVLTNPNLDPDVNAPKFCAAPPLCTVPSVVGQTKADAKAAIVAAGLALGNCTLDCRPIQPPGRIISTTPAGGSQVTCGSPVDYVVSKLGEVGVDNKVSAADLVTISTWITTYGTGKPKSIPSSSPYYVVCGDVTGDNKISAADLVQISTWITSLGAGKPKAIECKCP